MTYYLLLLAIFIWPFGQMLTFQVPGFTGTLYLLDLSLALVFTTLLLSRRSRLLVISDPLFKPLSIFLITATASLLVNFNSLSTSHTALALAYLIRLFIYPAAYFAARAIPPSRINKPIFASLVIFSIIGILQYLFLPDTRFLKELGFDDHYYRLIGSLFDPNFTGAILAASALYFIALGQWLVAIPLTLMLAATFSRASFLCFGLGMILIFIKRRKTAYLFAFFLLLATIIAIPKPFGEGVNLLRTFSIISRFESWSNGLELFFQRPLFGWGYNTLTAIGGTRFQTDNSFIFLAATTGMLGLISFFNLLFRSYKQIIHLSGKIFFVTILLHSLFNNSLFFIWILFAYWLALGISVKGYKQL